jgi:hypothetical protein
MAIKLVLVASLLSTQHYGLRTKTSWLGNRTPEARTLTITPPIYHTRGKNANHYTTDVVFSMVKEKKKDKTLRVIASQLMSGVAGMLV